MAAATPPTDEAVSYQEDVGHTGSVAASSLAPPLTRAWSVDLGGPTGYPILADGRVFVVAGNRDWNGTRLFALDPASGAVLWGPIDLGGGSQGLTRYQWQFAAATPTAPAFDSGKVFVVGGGYLYAFDAVTGALLWHIHTASLDASFDIAPLAINGTVFAHAYGSPGDINYAINESDGSIRWQTQNPYGAMAAATGNTIYFNAGCNSVAALDGQTGTVLWQNSGQGSANSLPPVLYQSRLYTTTFSGGTCNPADQILDAATGKSVGTFDASLQTMPAFDAGDGFWLTGSTLKAVNLSTMATLWSFTGDGHLDTSPVIANGVVYIGSSSGSVFGVSETGGTQVWTDSTGTPVTSSIQSTGLAIGLGALAVPAGSSLFFYRSAAAPPPPPIAPVTYSAPAHGSTWNTGDEATAYRIDPAHDANQAGDALAPPLQQSWSVDLGHRVSYAVIAGGRVFVSVNDEATTPHTTIYAFNRRTGRQIWSNTYTWPGPIAANLPASYVAYDAGTLFAVTGADTMTALDPATGAVRWSTSTGGGDLELGNPPIAVGGQVYDGMGQIGGVLYAFRESDGQVVWSHRTFNSVDGSAAADPPGNVYLPFGLNSAYSWTPAGASRWSQLPTGADDASLTAAYHESKIYSLGGTNAVRDSTTGTPLGAYSTAAPGAFDGDIGVFLVGHTLQALDLRNNHILWSTLGDGGLVSDPLIVSGVVYEGSTTGKVFALDDTHGTPLWSGDAGSAFAPAGTPWDLATFGGLSAGEGTLIAAAGTRLVAFNGTFDAQGHVALLPALANHAYGGYTTTSFIRNDGNSPAQVRIDFVDAAGQPAGFEYNPALSAHATWTVRQDDGRSLAPGQAASAVITSSQPVAAFVNETAPGGGDGSSYSSIQLPTGAGTTIYAPAIANHAYGGYTTGIGLINAGLAVTDVTITYRGADGATVATQSFPGVQPGQYVASYSGDPAVGLPNGFAGTATITSTGQPLAAVVNETGPGGQFTSYVGAAAGSTTLFAPVALANAYGGYNTGIGIVNTTGIAGTVTITYQDASGSPRGTTTHDLAANGYVAVYQGTDVPNAGAYSATITSTVPIAAVVNETAPSNASAKQATAYNAFAAGLSSANLALVENAGPDGLSSGEGIMNTGSSATTVTVTYFDASTGAPVGTPDTMTLQPNAYWGLYQPQSGLPAGMRATATISTSGGGTIAVVSNESNSTTFMSYSAQ